MQFILTCYTVLNNLPDYIKRAPRRFTMKEKQLHMPFPYRDLSLLDWLRILLMILAGLFIPLLYEPLRDLIDQLFILRTPTIHTHSLSITRLLVYTLEAILFIALSKNFTHWLGALIPQALLALGLMLYGLLFGGWLGLVIMGYFYGLHIGKSIFLQAAVVGINELLRIRLKRWSNIVCYSVCLILIASAIIQLFALPTIPMLKDEVNKVLRESELIDFKGSYHGDYVMDEIPVEEWKKIMPSIQADSTERPPIPENVDHGHGEALSMGFYSDSHKPFGPHVNIYWYEHYGYIQIDYRRATFYADDTAFRECVKEYYHIPE